MLSANDCTSQQNYTALCHFLSGAQNSCRGSLSKHYTALFVCPLPTCPIGLGGGVNGDRRRVVKAKCCYVAFKCSQIRESEQAKRRAASLAPALFRRPDRHVEKDCGNRGLVAQLLIRSLQHTWSHSHFSPRLTSNTQYMYSVFWKSKACLIQCRV